MGAVFLKDVELCHADEKDLAELSALGKLLWPGHTTDELKEEFLSEMKKNAHFFCSAYRDALSVLRSAHCAMTM